jgi:hypothetical protein
MAAPGPVTRCIDSMTDHIQPTGHSGARPKAAIPYSIVPQEVVDSGLAASQREWFAVAGRGSGPTPGRWLFRSWSGVRHCSSLIFYPLAMRGQNCHAIDKSQTFPIF